ncbi:MAG: dipeptidyl-peptidase-4 [Chitinophagales bacterium]|jgi:dipeptidyl-peptidase-4
MAIKLSNEALFKDWNYNAKVPTAVRWLDEGANYSVLETAAGYANAELEKDQYGNDIKIYQEVVQYDPVSLARSTLITLQQLTPKGADKALTVDDYQWSKDKSKLLIFTNAEYVWRQKDRGDYWVRDLTSGAFWQLGGERPPPGQMMFGKFSPNGLKFAYVWRNNIYLQDLTSREITALTIDASEETINGLFDWAYEEEFSIRDGFRWSSDSQKIAYWQLDTHAAKDFLIINNIDTLYPEVTATPYPKVGEENAAARIGVVSVDTAKTQWMSLPGVAKDMYVPRMDWANNNQQLLIQQFNRQQNTNTLFYADILTGKVKEFFSEREETFIELMIEPYWLKKSDDFIWQSERDGWKHVYRVARDGKRCTDLTPGEFDVTKLISIDEKNGWLYFIASPDNVSQRYLHRTRLDGSGKMEQVTPAKYAGSNQYQMSADSSWAIHTYSNFLTPPTVNLVSLPDHKVHHVLEDNAELVSKLSDLKLGKLEFFSVQAEDGLRLDGYMLRPSNMAPDTKYPLIHYVYGEPAGQTVNDGWSNNNLWHMLMSQQGYLISSIDNRGTRAPRGHAWRRSIYASDGHLETRDQSNAITAMCARWSYIDCSRVGVWGHSGGGSLTLSLMFRYPKQFKVGVSIAPVPDKRLYDSIYQERYSGLLSDYEDNYIEFSAITHAAKLEGKLLLVHGTGDDNVHYQGSERLINELVKHNRQFDLMAYPNRRHSIVEGLGTSLHLHSMKSDYFYDHL